MIIKFIRHFTVIVYMHLYCVYHCHHITRVVNIINRATIHSRVADRDHLPSDANDIHFTWLVALGACMGGWSWSHDRVLMCARSPLDIAENLQTVACSGGSPAIYCLRTAA